MTPPDIGIANDLLSVDREIELRAILRGRLKHLRETTIGVTFGKESINESHRDRFSVSVHPSLTSYPLDLGHIAFLDRPVSYQEDRNRPSSVNAIPKALRFLEQSWH